MNVVTRPPELDKRIPYTNPLKRKKGKGKRRYKRSQDATARSITRASFMPIASRPVFCFAACTSFLEAIRAVHAVGSLGLGDSALGRVQDVLDQVLGVLYTAADAHQVIVDSDTVGGFQSAAAGNATGNAAKGGEGAC